MLLSFLEVSTIRYRTFKDAHASRRSLAVMAFLALTGLAVGWVTRASFVLVVYMAAYVVMGIAESVFFHARRIPNLARLPAAVRAELEADEALEPSDEEDEAEDKDERDEFI
jgi:CDP-diacylglycerol--serine O-phosphatidyltransferase